MRLENLELDHSVELLVSLGGKSITLLTVLKHKIGQNALVAPIIMDEKVVGFPSECNISFIYPTSEGVYAWHGLLLKAVRYGKNIYHCTTLTGEAEMLNRRGAYRVEIGTKMQVTIFTSSGQKNDFVTIKDISESGFAFLSSDQFENGRLVRLKLDTPKGSLKLSANIVRNQPTGNGMETLYGCHFAGRSAPLSAYLAVLQQQQQRAKMGALIPPV